MVLGVSEQEIFLVEATRCRRCGGLLTSEEAVKNGIGHRCAEKLREEELAAEAAKLQINVFDILEGE